MASSAAHSFVAESEAPASIVAAIAAELQFAARTSTVEYQHNWINGLHWTLRCYGQGVCTLGRGAPSRYNTEAEALRVGAVWVETGVAAADQRVAS